MTRYISIYRFRALGTRVFLLILLTFISIPAFCDLGSKYNTGGWIPTSCGLVVHLEPGDQFRLSTMVGDVEYFICDYVGEVETGIFSYSSSDTIVKLIPRRPNGTPPAGSVWTVREPLDRNVKMSDQPQAYDYAMDGIIYTMWSEDGHTLITSPNNDYEITGLLASNDDPKNKKGQALCDVVFAIPTVQSTCADPNNSLKRAAKKGDPFDGKMGVDENGEVWREVWWFNKGRRNGPNSYTSTSLTGVDTVLNRNTSGKIWQINAKSASSGSGARYRKLFRLYIIKEHSFNTCPDSYFFSHDEQDFKKYRLGNAVPGDSTDAVKIYTSDHHHCMERVGSSSIFRTDWMELPTTDSAYYYIGKKNKFYSAREEIPLGPVAGVYSHFRSIQRMRVKGLKDAVSANVNDFCPKPGAYGRVEIDSACNKENLGAYFEPAGYFLRIHTTDDRYMNVRMTPNADSTEWSSESVWLIDASYGEHVVKTTLYTGSDFNSLDEGADIIGWSEYVKGKDIPLLGGGSVLGKYGWPLLYTNSSATNGGLVFVEADVTKSIQYDNNGHFGAEVPTQYATTGSSTVTIRAPRLLRGYDFDGWTTNADGTGTKYRPGDVVDLSAVGPTLHLYAKATYTGSINVAISFLKEDGKRYFLTHPGVAPRMATARHFEDWTNVWQGMKDINNDDPSYLSSYKLIGHEGECVECKDGEYVLDPHREPMRGGEDSLLFYENFKPANEEYIGLYYQSPYTVIANNTWAGLFRSSRGWPTPAKACIDSTRLSSSHYLSGYPSSITRIERGNSNDSTIHYNPSTNYFDGGNKNDSTIFTLSGVGVVDAHYVILPDTTDLMNAWTDEITFDYHTTSVHKQVWSKLIGKQLLAQMKVGKDTIYFHPNNKKTYTTANALNLSTEYNLIQSFELIHDSRTALGIGDSVMIEQTENGFCCNLMSGNNTPMGIAFDIVDTLRVRLSTRAASRIKEYYGRWNDRASGLHKSADGSRYRDILIRTKTYHNGADQTRYILKPLKDEYNFGPLVGQSETLNFILTLETYHQVLDAEDHVISEEITNIDTIPSFSIQAVSCTFASTSTSPGTNFSITQALNEHVTLATRNENTEGANVDTLIISNIHIGDVPHAVNARIPLLQAALVSNEFIWSVWDDTDKLRYYIMAGTGGLIYRRYTEKNSYLYKLNTTNQLKKGSKNAVNDDVQYITPWIFKYKADDQSQLSLKINGNVNMKFNISGDVPGVHASDSVLLTYRIISSNTNSNANYEELMRLKYGADKWLSFNESTNQLELVNDSASASIFSWSYMLWEHNIQNNGDYPSVNMVEFGFEDSIPASVKTAYQGYREYTTLINNVETHFAKETRTQRADLTSTDPAYTWKTTYNVSLVHDSRFKNFGEVIDTAHVNVVDSLTEFITTIKPLRSHPSHYSPRNTNIGGKYVNIVDTLKVTVGLQNGAPKYKYQGTWSRFKSLSDACLSIPIIRKTYHEQAYDSLVCVVADDEYNHVFPNSISAGINDSYTFDLGTARRQGTQLLDVDNNIVYYNGTETDLTSSMHLNRIDSAEIRLVDEYGNMPDWCEITDKTATTITVRCKSNGIRAPRIGYIYLAYIVMIGEDMRFINQRLAVSQPSLYRYANNQTLEHTKGASGDPLREDGRQQVHENKRILYYYHPGYLAKPEQYVELPIRERGFYGWWRWYQEKNGVDSDIPQEKWKDPPLNTGKHDFPFRIIGDSVYTINPETGDTIDRKLATMGRYTVFYNPSKDYGTKLDPPSKSPRVIPPTKYDTVTYVADIGNYYDNLPLSTDPEFKNQIDTARLDTMEIIKEPTLSVREVFELHPWTEMAARLDTFKYTDATPWASQKYMEDHVVMAPLFNRLLLRTEQRYSYDNLKAKDHSESLLGYYMRDDNWSTWAGNTARQDTMIWCGGWDVDCKWYTYDPKKNKYTASTYNITVEDDLLNVPAKMTLPSGREFDTVYYCLRARSKASTFDGEGNVTTDDDGAYMFNICRYMVIYHHPYKYGPWPEGGGKAIITDDQITDHYEVLERLNFDYNRPGSSYRIYPHPLPWSDASYGYTYPLSSAVPQNRYHDEKDFPGPGEYAIINKIPYTTYWRPMQQHGGAANGYMIYCDGMSSAGQVAALSLTTKLCEGQHMYFSAYVGNVSNQEGKSKPNFTISVQGSADGKNWDDITSFMTGDIEPSDNWYQIFFPIEFDRNEQYVDFRVRIYNMASSFDGNDFVIDDMCLFATKPQLVAYQANTTCSEHGQNDSTTHVVLRVDYQGFTDVSLNDRALAYMVEQSKDGGDTTSLRMEDGYFGQVIKHENPDTIYGSIQMPSHTYEPINDDSIFASVQALINKYEESEEAGGTLFREGYVYEDADGVIRPVLYVVHKAKVAPDIDYTVRMAMNFEELHSSICAMTSRLKVKNRMMLELNGEEHPKTELEGLCANSNYNISLRVKGSLMKDSIAPVDVDGSCVNDWLLYGDTAEASSLTRYGYKYSDITKVITKILRYESKTTNNANQFAHNMSEISRSELERIQTVSHTETGVELSEGVVAYNLLSDLVSKGFLTLYHSNLMGITAAGDSLVYVIYPIVGTGSEALTEAQIEVCPTPIFVKLKAAEEGVIPMTIGGLHRSKEEESKPIIVLVDEATANNRISILIDSIVTVAPYPVLDSIMLISTNDPNYIDGVHSLNLLPDRIYNFSAGGDNSGYYKNGDYLVVRPENSGTYHMRAGYNYTFAITMQTRTGAKTIESGCRVGSVPFTISVVPDNLKWDPKAEGNNKWNNSDNWIGIDEDGEPIHSDAHYAPLASTNVIIPALGAGLSYPVLLDTTSISSGDSVKQVGFKYNTCDNIRFLPGAVIASQERLKYNNAVVDMSLPNGKWAFRSAPVKGMLSGDIFMANADLDGTSSPWEVGAFDANGRNASTGNASFWLSVYSKTTAHIDYGADASEERTATAEWSKVTNAMTLSLPPALGWAIYTQTASLSDAAVRLPKTDDIYYYYTRSGDKTSQYVSDLQSTRDINAGGSGKAGELAFHPSTSSEGYRITKDAAEGEIGYSTFVFGNPTMAYIDIWGFIADNSLKEEISYMNESGEYITVETKSSALATSNVITEQKRYLPPMHAIVVKKATNGLTYLDVTLNTSRVVTEIVPDPAPAPQKRSIGALKKGIMTVTAINHVSSRCISRLLIGQGYNDAVQEGEDAVLTTVNKDNFSMVNTPTTPFNIYAVDGGYGLSIDLKDSVVNVPISFSKSALPFKPTTHLWFTGVNNISGSLVLYDALTGEERSIIDGIRLDIETPEYDNQMRYYIRRRGYGETESSGSEIATEVEQIGAPDGQVIKIVHEGKVYIIRNGHVYSVFGQKIR